MDQCAQGPLDIQVSWISSHLSSECQRRKLFCFPKRQGGQDKCSLCSTQLPLRHSPLCSVYPLFFSCCHHSLFTLVSSSACNRFSLFCTGCSPEQWSVKNIYFYFLSKANKELSITGRAQRFRIPPVAPAVCWLCCSMGMSVWGLQGSAWIPMEARAELLSAKAGENPTLRAERPPQQLGFIWFLSSCQWETSLSGLCLDR